MNGTHDDAKMAEATGGLFSPDGTGRYRRVLREHEEFPASGKGGGKSAAIVFPEHRAKLVISFGSDTSLGAAAAVKAIAPLRYAAKALVFRPHAQKGPHTELAGEIQDRRGPGSVTLLQFLSDEIRRNSDPEWRRRQVMHCDGMTISLCVSPPSATITSPTSNGIWTYHFLPEGEELLSAFLGLPKPKAPGHKITVLPYGVIFAAGEMWEETLARHPELASTLPSVSAVPDAGLGEVAASDVPESPPVPGGAGGCDDPRHKLGVNGVPAPSTPDRLKPTRRCGSSERKHSDCYHEERESQSAPSAWADSPDQNEGKPPLVRRTQRAHDECEPHPAGPLCA